MARMTISIAQHSRSDWAETASASTPTGRSRRLLSVRIRPRTGKAVTDTEMPTNRANGRRRTPWVVVYRAKAATMPSRNGATVPVRAIVADRPRRFDRQWPSRSTSSPIMNMKSTTPIWAIAASWSCWGAGKMLVAHPPKIVGPRSIPATISPMTIGWRSRRQSQVSGQVTAAISASS